MPNRIMHGTAAALFSLLVIGTASAQTSALIAKASSEAPEKQYRYLKVQHGIPSEIAWFMDPAHNPVPEAYQPDDYDSNKAPDRNASKSREGVFQLPQGIESIVPVDAQSALLVYGTARGMRQLETIVGFLDKPRQRVEVTAMVACFNKEDVGQLGIDPQIAKGPFSLVSPSVGYVKSHFPPVIDSLVEQKRARIVFNRHFSIANNTRGKAQLSVSRPAIISVRAEGGASKAVFDMTLADQPSSINVVSSTKLAITPTVNNDNTITLVVGASKMLEMTTNRSASSKPLSPPAGAIETTANVKDGDTIALTGLSPHLFAPEEAFGEAPVDADANHVCVLFLTAHVLPAH